MAAVSLDPEEFSCLQTGEFLILLSSFAAGCPAVGSLINMVLNTLFGSSSQDPWSGLQIQNLISNIQNMIETAAWTQINDTVEAIQEEMQYVASETEPQIYSAFNGTIRTNCFALRNALISASQMQGDVCGYALKAYYPIAFLDLITLNACLQMENRANAGHVSDYNNAVDLYTSTDSKDAKAIYPKLSAGYATWRPTSLQWQQTQWVDTPFPPYNYQVYDTWNSTIIESSCGDVETKDDFQSWVAAFVASELAGFEASIIQNLDIMVNTDTSPNVLNSGAEITIGINDVESGLMGPAYAAVFQDGTELSLQRNIIGYGKGLELGQNALFQVEKVGGTGSVIYYGDTVTIRSKPFSLYLAGGEFPNPARIILEEAGEGISQGWVILNPYAEYLPGYEGAGVQIPVTTQGQFVLQNQLTGWYFGAMRPPGPFNYKVPTFFGTTPSIENTGRYLVSSIATACTDEITKPT